MKFFEQATLAEIRELAFTKPAFEILLELLPEDLPGSTIFYDIEFLHEVKIPELVEPLVKEVTELLNEKYPFLSLSTFGFETNMGREYFNYYFSEVDCIELSYDITKGTELEYLEVLYYRSEEPEPK